MIIYLINKIISENVKFIKASEHFVPNISTTGDFLFDYVFVNQ